MKKREAELVVRSAYSPRLRVQIGPGGASKTKQSFKDECDIGNILKQFKRTGVLPHQAAMAPVFMDCAEVGDYQTALDNVRKGEELFYQLDSDVRAEFGNDPAAFLDHVVNADEEELIRLGIFANPEEPSGKAASVEPGGQAGGASGDVAGDVQEASEDGSE